MRAYITQHISNNLYTDYMYESQEYTCQDQTA